MTDTLVIGGLAAGYAGRAVLRGLDLAPLPAGRITALVGPNAAGKSTLLRALAGLVPAQGRAQFGATDLIACPPATRAGLVGFVPQAVPGDAALGVLESAVAALKASSHAGSIATARRRALHTLDQLGIADLAMTRLNRLSGGQRQLAGIAQAMVRQPPLLLLDEPTSALDLHHQVVVMGRLRRLAAAGHLVVVVLHDLMLAARWADHLVVLADGAVAAEGLPAEIITPTLLARVYRIAARIGRCERGHLQIMVDDIA
ncbi:MAG: ABC transporter ATP-binding protein [Ferrovibrionaceae bacterium]